MEVKVVSHIIESSFWTRHRILNCERKLPKTRKLWTSMIHRREIEAWQLKAIVKRFDTDVGIVTTLTFADKWHQTLALFIDRRIRGQNESSLFRNIFRTARHQIHCTRKSRIRYRDCCIIRGKGLPINRDIAGIFSLWYKSLFLPWSYCRLSSQQPHRRTHLHGEAGGDKVYVGISTRDYLSSRGHIFWRRWKYVCGSMHQQRGKGKRGKPMPRM
jgi:hypothetical protein